MPTIPIDLSGTHEPKPVPGGVYNLVIATAEEALSKEKQKPMIVCYIGIDGHLDAPSLRHNISLPNEGDEPKTSQFKMLLLKRFLELFGISYGPDGFEIESFPGATAKAEVKLSAPDANGNVYNELILPRMKEEGGAGSVGKVTKPPKQ